MGYVFEGFCLDPVFECALLHAVSEGNSTKVSFPCAIADDTGKRYFCASVAIIVNIFVYDY